MVACIQNFNQFAVLYEVIPALKSLAEIIIFAPSFLYHNQLYCIRQPARKLEYSLSFKVSCLFVRKINTGKRCYRNIFSFKAFDFYFFMLSLIKILLGGIHDSQQPKTIESLLYGA